MSPDKYRVTIYYKVGAPDASREFVSQIQYRRIAEFRYRIRQFLHFSEQAARASGIEPQQHQLLLAIKGMPEGRRATIKMLAERLYLRHHSTVELIDRLVKHGAVVRRHNSEDRREVLVELTLDGERMLEALSILHWQELQASGPALSEALGNIVRRRKPGPKKTARRDSQK